MRRLVIARMSEVENGRREMSMLRMKSSTLRFLTQTIFRLLLSAKESATGACSQLQSFTFRSSSYHSSH